VKAGKLACDICGKLYGVLGSYGDHDDGGWWVCLKCFAKADELAEKEDRWPNARDFERLKDGMR
jgi:hypothetical protein